MRIRVIRVIRVQSFCLLSFDHERHWLCNWPTTLAYFTCSRDLSQQIGLEKDVQEEEVLITEVQENIQG